MTDDVTPTPKDGVTLHLLCVKDAVRAGWFRDLQSVDLAAMKAKAFWMPFEGSIEDLKDASVRVTCSACGERHRLKTLQQVKAEGAVDSGDYALIVDVLVDETGLVGEPALERARRAVKGTNTKRIGVGRVGRNDPCPCGSGKKFKKCCGVSR